MARGTIHEMQDKDPDCVKSSVWAGFVVINSKFQRVVLQVSPHSEDQNKSNNQKKNNKKKKEAKRNEVKRNWIKSNRVVR